MPFTPRHRNSRPRRNSHTEKSTAGEATSWDKVGKWYDKEVGNKGHYYHQHVVLPGVKRLLNLQPGDSLVDLGCGQGVLARTLATKVEYLGIDAAHSLIASAEKQNQHESHQFIVGDITKKPRIEVKPFSHATMILSLQNVAEPHKAINNAASLLQTGGKFVMVLNHPCFRIPRQSSWGIDETNKLQYRRINRYLSFLKIPIKANPSQGEKATVTWSFHFPLESLSQWLNKAGFVITTLEEWGSDKVSVGKAAKMENRSRSEIPLFLAVVAEKRK